MKNTPLTSEQQALIISKYENTLNKELAALVGCSVAQVKYLAKTKKLTKTPAHVSAASSAKSKSDTAYMRRNLKKKAQPSPRKLAKPEPKAVVRPWHYPMNSPEYKAWEASLLEGRTRTPILDANGRTAYVYRRNG